MGNQVVRSTYIGQELQVSSFSTASGLTDKSVSSSEEKAGQKQTDLSSSPDSGGPPLRPWANQVT